MNECSWKCGKTKWIWGGRSSFAYAVALVSVSGEMMKRIVNVGANNAMSEHEKMTPIVVGEVVGRGEMSIIRNVRYSGNVGEKGRGGRNEVNRRRERR